LEEFVATWLFTKNLLRAGQSFCTCNISTLKPEHPPNRTPFFVPKKALKASTNPTWQNNYKAPNNQQPYAN
jgi:hypothetical protein